MLKFVGKVAAVGMALACTSALAQTPQQPVAQNIADMLKVCFECHGEGGLSVIPTRPTIAGQKSQYIANQLYAFRQAAETESKDDDADSGLDQPALLQGRIDPVMSHMVDSLTDTNIAQIATALSQLSCDKTKIQLEASSPTANPVGNLGVMPDAGQRCVSCHGENGIGKMPNVPNMAGQQRGYLRRQLLSIRETAWGAEPRENEMWRSHPIMERQAARLSIEDVDALARYYSALDCRGQVLR